MYLKVSLANVDGRAALLFFSSLFSRFEIVSGFSGTGYVFNKSAFYKELDVFRSKIHIEI
jgi:hypothetical protein